MLTQEMASMTAKKKQTKLNNLLPQNVNQETASMTAKKKQTKLNNLLPQNVKQEMLCMKEMSEPNPSPCHCSQCMAKEMPNVPLPRRTKPNKLLLQKMMEEMTELNHNLPDCIPTVAKEMTKLTRLPKVHLSKHYSPSL
jgi:hypothetical protein